MSLNALHPIFWVGGRFDDAKRRGEQAELEVQQARYIATINAEAQMCQGIAAMVRPPVPLRIQIARGMDLYNDGNMNPWEWLIDLLERGVNDVDDYVVFRGDISKM